MYSKTDLINCMVNIGIKPNETLLVHSSMKSIGNVVGGADTVLDAFIEYMKPGLLVFPTHTWTKINEENCVFNPLSEPSCVGILSNLFLKRSGVVRSLNPTHSVGALGEDAVAFIEGEEKWNTPSPRGGCLGKLYDRKAKVLFLGCSLGKNTFLHGVEEWNQVPMRLADKYQNLKIITPDGRLFERITYTYHNPFCDVSENYRKMEEPLIYTGIAKKGLIGDAVSVLCDVVGMADLTVSFLNRNLNLFGDSSVIPTDWYMKQKY